MKGIIIDPPKHFEENQISPKTSYEIPVFILILPSLPLKISIPAARDIKSTAKSLAESFCCMLIIVGVLFAIGFCVYMLITTRFEIYDGYVSYHMCNTTFEDGACKLTWAGKTCHQDTPCSSGYVRCYLVPDQDPNCPTLDSPHKGDKNYTLWIIPIFAILFIVVCCVGIIRNENTVP